MLNDETYYKALLNCIEFNCENCPLKDKDWCQELLDAEAYRRETENSND